MWQEKKVSSRTDSVQMKSGENPTTKPLEGTRTPSVCGMSLHLSHISTELAIKACNNLKAEIDPQIIQWIIDFLIEREPYRVDAETLELARKACIKHYRSDVLHGNANAIDPGSLKRSMQTVFDIDNWERVCNFERKYKLEQKVETNVVDNVASVPNVQIDTSPAEPVVTPAEVLGKRKRTKPGVLVQPDSQKTIPNLSVVKPTVSVGQNKKGMVVHVDTTACTVVWIITSSKQNNTVCHLQVETCIPSSLVLFDDPFPCSVQLEEGKPIDDKNIDNLMFTYAVELGKLVCPDLKRTDNLGKSFLEWWNGHYVRKPPALKFDSAFVRNMIAICKNEASYQWMMHFFHRDLRDHHGKLPPSGTLETSGKVSQFIGYFKYKNGKSYKPITDAQKDALFQRIVVGSMMN